MVEDRQILLEALTAVGGQHALRNQVNNILPLREKRQSVTTIATKPQ